MKRLAIKHRNLISWFLAIGILAGSFFVSNVRSEPLAFSLLGMCNESWDCDASEQLFAQSSVIRFRWLDGGTFGSTCPCVTRMLANEKPKIVAPHIVNSTCFPERGRRCHEEEIFSGETVASADAKVRVSNAELMKKFENAARATKNRLLKAAGTTSAYISPCLECSLSGPSRKILLAATKKIFEEEEPVLVPAGYIDNPVRGSCLEGYICEKHGDRVSAPIVDLDGVDLRDADLEYFRNQNTESILTFIWAKEWNCLAAGVKNHVDPRDRRCTALPENTLKEYGIKLTDSD